MKEFDREYIETELGKLAGKLERPVKLYVIGGGAMAFRDQKEGTKDIDVILETGKEADALAAALEDLGYQDPLEVDAPYQRMGARRMLENSDEFRWDIFVQEVMGFSFSERMMKRSEPWLEAGPLTVVAASSEDIFTFKALTDRPRDRDDMDILWSEGLETDTIQEEVLEQAENPAGKRFAAFFYQGLEEFVELTGAVVPGMETYETLYEREMVAEVIETRLADGPVSITGFAKATGVSEEVVQDAGERLRRQGRAVVAEGEILPTDAGPAPDER